LHIHGVPTMAFDHIQDCFCLDYNHQYLCREDDWPGRSCWQPPTG
jgi:hypothetical protein